MSFEIFKFHASLLSSFFPVSQWEAWNLFQMTFDGATRFNVTEPLLMGKKTGKIKEKSVQNFSFLLYRRSRRWIANLSFWQSIPMDCIEWWALRIEKEKLFIMSLRMLFSGSFVSDDQRFQESYLQIGRGKRVLKYLTKSLKIPPKMLWESMKKKAFFGIARSFGSYEDIHCLPLVWFFFV